MAAAISGCGAISVPRSQVIDYSKLAARPANSRSSPPRSWIESWRGRWMSLMQQVRRSTDRCAVLGAEDDVAIPVPGLYQD